MSNDFYKQYFGNYWWIKKHFYIVSPSAKAWYKAEVKMRAIIYPFINGYEQGMNSMSNMKG